MTTAHDILARAGLRASYDLAFALERSAELTVRMLDAERATLWFAEASSELLAGATSFEQQTQSRTWGQLQPDTWRNVNAPRAESLLLAPILRAGKRVAAIGAERQRPWSAEERQSLDALVDIVQTILDQAAWIGADGAALEAVQATRDAQSTVAKLAASLVHDLNTITATLALSADNLSVMEDAPEWLLERAKELDQLAAAHRPIADQLRELSRGRLVETVDVRVLFTNVATRLAAMPRRIEVISTDDAVMTRGVRRELEQRIVSRLLAVCDATPRDATISVRIGRMTVIEAGRATIELPIGDPLHAATSALDIGTKKPV